MSLRGTRFRGFLGREWENVDFANFAGKKSEFFGLLSKISFKKYLADFADFAKSGDDSGFQQNQRN
jgi:hypothetical protein